MLLAGGQGSRLYALTSQVAKPAVPFGGKYRIIDFPLSNCVNSGIDTVGVLTQYRPLELNSYIGSGQPWDLDRSDGGVHILPPYMREGDQGTWYKGTANAIYQNIGFLDLYDPDYVVILSGDHIYKMDYSDMVAQHKKTEAACTISVLEVTLEEAKRFGIMNANEDGQVYEFEEKPQHPKSTLASMGIYVFTWSKLRQYLIDDEADPNSSNDFGKNIIPNMLTASPAIGRTWAPSTPCGMPTWTCWPPTAASTCMIPAGPSTPAAPSSPPTSPAPTPRSPILWSPAAVRWTARWKTRYSSTPSQWRKEPTSSIPSSCPARW